MTKINIVRTITALIILTDLILIGTIIKYFNTLNLVDISIFYMCFFTVKVIYLENIKYRLKFNGLEIRKNSKFLQM